MSALGAPRAKLIVRSAISASSIRTVRYSAHRGMKAADPGIRPGAMDALPTGGGSSKAPDASAILLPDAGVARVGEDRTAGLWQRRLRDRPRAGRSADPLG